MIGKLSLALACVCSLLSPACQTSTSRRNWEQAESGKPLGARDLALLHTVAIVDPDPTVGQFCTGTVVGKRQIVTAAHCFEDKQRIPYVYLEKNYQPGASFEERGVLLRIELAAVHGRHQKGQARDDLALALIESEVIPPYRPVRLPTGKEDLKTSRLYFAGYGCPGSGCDENESELRKAELQFVRTLDPMTVELRGRHQETAEGDSGGPTYRLEPQGLVVLTIASDLEVDTLVAPYRSWIEEGIKVLERPMIQNQAYRIIDFTEKEGD